jgi:hypothetical protein
MNTAAEFEAAFPEPHVILGVRLLPLSIGRYRLLKRFNSPFVSEEENTADLKATIGELLFALLICGMKCAEFREILENGDVETECKRMGKNLVKISAAKNFSALEEIGMFQSFIAESSKLPWHVIREGNNTQESPSHWSHGIEVVLRSKIGWTQIEIEEEPIAKALCDFFKYSEGEGFVKLISHDNYNLMQADAQSNADAFEDMVKEAEACL